MFFQSERHGGAIQRDTGPGGPSNTHYYRELSKYDFPGLETDNMRECIANFERHSRRLRLSEKQNFEAAIEFLPSDKVGNYFNCLKDSEKESYDSLKNFILQQAEPNIVYLMKDFSQEARVSNIDDLIKTAGRIVNTCPKDDITKLLVSFLCPAPVKDQAQTYIKYGLQRWQELVESWLDRYEEYKDSVAVPTNNTFKAFHEKQHSGQTGGTQKRTTSSIPSATNSQVHSAVEQPRHMREACVGTIVAFSQSHSGEKSEEFINNNESNSKINSGAASPLSPTDTPLPTTNVSKKIRNLQKKIKKLKGKITKTFEKERSTSETNHTRTWVGVINSRKPPTDTRAKIEQTIKKKQRSDYLYTKKQRSVIIFNVPAAPSSDDKQMFLEICKAIKIKPKVEEATRIRSCRADCSQPLKVTFENLADKKNFLRTATFFQFSEFSSLKISHDMTPSEKNLNKTLLRAAYELNQQAPANSFVYKVRGPPWNSRIVKVSKLIQSG